MRSWSRAERLAQAASDRHGHHGPGAAGRGRPPAGLPHEAGAPPGPDRVVKFLQHVLRLPVTFFQHRFAGDIVGRVVSTARVARLISGELATTRSACLSLVFFVAAMLPYDPLLTVCGRGHRQSEPDRAPLVQPLADRRTGDRANRGRLAGGSHVGDPDHRIRQGRRRPSRT